MRVAPIPTIFAFSSITILIHALPFAPREPQRQQAHFKRVPYSVVAVDGSSPSSASIAAGTETKTVTQALDATETVTATLPPSILTIVATITVSQPQSEKTVFVTPTPSPVSTGSVPPSSKSALDPAQPAEITVSVVPLPVSTSLSSSPSLSSISSTGTLQSLSTAQQAVSTISVLAIPVATPATPSSFSISSNTSDTAIIARPTSTTSYDDGSWLTSYPAWSPTSSSISISTSIPSIKVPSFSLHTENYGAATVTPSPTRQDYLPTGGVASWNTEVYSGTSLKSWNGTVV